MRKKAVHLGGTDLEITVIFVLQKMKILHREGVLRVHEGMLLSQGGIGFKGRSVVLVVGALEGRVEIEQRLLQQQLLLL